MANRNDGQIFPTTGRPPDGQIRPSWMEKEVRNTTDSGMGSMETRYGLLPPQPGGRKRHADDGTLRRMYADIPKNANSVPWDGPHKRILFQSEDPESTLSGSETRETRSGWPPDDLCADSTPKTTTDIGTVIVDVKPIVKKQPDRLEVESIDRTDGRVNCLVNMVLTPRERERQYSGIRTQAGELLPESREGIPNEMAEEVTTGGLADGCEVVTKTNAMKAITKDDVIIRPVPRLLCIEVVEETRRNENTFEEYTDGHLVKDETTKLGVSTELVDLSQKLITRGFLELAEEARIVDLRLTPSFCMNEIIQQITETTEPMGRDISWKIEEVMEQSLDSFCDVAMKVPTAKFDIGQLMQWPDVNPAGMMICEFTLDSEMFAHGSVRREAEPVFVAAESEVFTQVFTGGGGGDGSSRRRAP